MPQARLEVGNTIQALRISLEENGAQILKLTLVFALVSAVSSLLDVAGPAGLAISFGILILIGAIYSGMINALICLPGKSDGAGELWAVVKPVLARLIWVNLLITVCLVLGLIAFVIPALIIATVWSVAIQTIVVERKAVFESLGRSYELVQGSGWRVFLYLLLLGIVTLLLLGLALLVSAPLGTGPVGTVVGSFVSNLLSTPLLVVGVAVLYKQLVDLERGRSGRPPIEDDATESTEDGNPPPPLP